MDQPLPNTSLRRYVRLAFVVANNMTAGKALSALVV